MLQKATHVDYNIIGLIFKTNKSFKIYLQIELSMDSFSLKNINLNQ